MGSVPSIPSGAAPQPAKPQREIAPYLEKRRINAEEKYGTFSERVAELNKYRETAKIDKKNDTDRLVRCYDAQGDFVGGFYTERAKNGKIKGIVTIGHVTYSTDDITGKGQITRIHDTRGPVATDRNGDGTINPDELTIITVPNDRIYHTPGGKPLLSAPPDHSELASLNHQRRRPFGTKVVAAPEQSKD